MPAPYGITDTGFNRPTLAEIKADWEAAWITAFGADSDLTPGSPDSQIIGIASDREDAIWQGLEDNYNSKYPDTAFGASLDNVRAISGIPRLGAMASKITGAKMFGTAGTLISGISSGGVHQISVSGSPTSIFQLDSDVTLIAGQSCIQTITFSSIPTAGTWQLSLGGFVIPSFAFNASALTIQNAIQGVSPFLSGTTVTGNYSIGFTINFNGAETGGLQVQPVFTATTSGLVNGILVVTIHPTITQAGIDQGVGNFTCTVDGPTVANAYTATVINTPVSGWSGVFNPSDATIGRNVEADNAYRARSAQELQIAGAGTLEAIRADLLTVSGVTAVIPFENTSDVTDLNGLPPKSFEMVVQGGTDADIAAKLWASKDAGIETFGTITVQVSDSVGQPHNVSFSRPTPVPIYIALTLTIDATFPPTGSQGAKTALADAGNALGIGKEVIVSPYLISSLAAIPGIQNVVLLIGTSPGPTLPNNIPISINQIATFDTSHIAVSLIGP